MPPSRSRPISASPIAASGGGSIMEVTDGHRLVRRRDDRVIAGVCGGIADHFAIDVTLVRVAAVVFTFFGGAGALLYVVAWAMIPEEGHTHGYADRWMRGGWQPIAGVVLIAIAFATISGRLWHLHDIGFPLFLIGFGVFLLWFSPQVGRPSSAPPPPPAPPPSAGGAAGAVAEGMVAAAATTETTATATEPVAPEAEARSLLDDERAEARRQRRERMEARREWRREQHRVRRAQGTLTPATIGILAIGAGVTGIALANDASIDATRVLAIGVVVVGAALLVATVYGRAATLVPVGLVLVAALTAVSIITVPFKGGVGQRTYQPITLSDLDPEYHLAVGEMHLDLGSIRPPTGSTTRVLATVGVGHLVIDVPRDVEVAVRGHADLGRVDIVGLSTDDGGWHIDRDRVLHRGVEGTARIELDAQVGLGQVEVRDA